MRPFTSLFVVELLVAGLFIQPSAFAQSVTTPTSITVTPIQHLVVIFQENISFDHYFATYPKATNPQGEPAFTPGLPGLLMQPSPSNCMFGPHVESKPLGSPRLIGSPSTYAYLFRLPGLPELPAIESGLQNRPIPAL